MRLVLPVPRRGWRRQPGGAGVNATEQQRSTVAIACALVRRRRVGIVPVHGVSRRRRSSYPKPLPPWFLHLPQPVGRLDGRTEGLLTVEPLMAVGPTGSPINPILIG